VGQEAGGPSRSARVTSRAQPAAPGRQRGSNEGVVRPLTSASRGPRRPRLGSTSTPRMKWCRRAAPTPTRGGGTGSSPVNLDGLSRRATGYYGEGPISLRGRSRTKSHTPPRQKATRWAGSTADCNGQHRRRRPRARPRFFFAAVGGSGPGSTDPPGPRPNGSTAEGRSDDRDEWSTAARTRATPGTPAGSTRRWGGTGNWRLPDAWHSYIGQEPPRQFLRWTSATHRTSPYHARQATPRSLIRVRVRVFARPWSAGGKRKSICRNNINRCLPADRQRFFKTKPVSAKKRDRARLVHRCTDSAPVRPHAENKGNASPSRRPMPVAKSSGTVSLVACPS